MDFNKTELSNYVWDLKRNNKEPHITWTIVCKVYGIPKRNFCRLCLKEKLLIIKFPNQDIFLNKRSECINKCRHENKTLINAAFSVFLIFIFNFTLDCSKIVKCMPDDCISMKLEVAYL